MNLHRFFLFVPFSFSFYILSLIIQKAVQATALRTLSNLSYGSGEDILSSFGLVITPLIRAMKRHIMHNKVQLYGCCTLHYIANTYRREISEPWGVMTILSAMKEYYHDIMLQEQGCAALSIIMDEKIDDDINAFMKNEGLTYVLESMNQSPQNIEIQKYGLRILNCLKTKDNYELMLSGGGLDLILSDMNSFDYQVDIAMQCCEILKNFTRMSLDFQRAVSAKGGYVEYQYNKRIVNCHYLINNQTRISESAFFPTTFISHDFCTYHDNIFSCLVYYC